MSLAFAPGESQRNFRKDHLSLETQAQIVANSGVYFITCVFLGRRFVKIGRSVDIKRRRSQLQSGCPFKLRIEHVESMPESDAIVKEREWHALFKDMRKNGEWYKAINHEEPVQLMLRWFPYSNDIEDFVEGLKAGNNPGGSDEDGDCQGRLFIS